MSDPVQMTLIICITLTIIVYLTTDKGKSDDKLKLAENEKDNSGLDEIFNRCKSPTYPAPPRPGQGYQPKSRYHDNNKLEKVRPPKTGSGIK